MPPVQPRSPPYSLGRCSDEARFSTIAQLARPKEEGLGEGFHSSVRSWPQCSQREFERESEVVHDAEDGAAPREIHDGRFHLPNLVFDHRAGYTKLSQDVAHGIGELGREAVVARRDQSGQQRPLTHAEHPALALDVQSIGVRITRQRRRRAGLSLDACEERDGAWVPEMAARNWSAWRARVSAGEAAAALSRDLMVERPTSVSHRKATSRSERSARDFGYAHFDSRRS